MLYLQEDIADKVLHMLFGAMDELTLDNPWHLTTDVGPVIDEASKTKVESHIAAHAAKGNVLKQLLAPKTGLFVGPTVIKLNGIEDLSEEIFGPVLAIQTFRTVDEVITKANNTPYGLSAGVWTDKGSKIFNLTSQLKAGVVWANTYNKFDPTSPFGGYKESGHGREGGLHGLEPYLKFD
jgi:aldehyde dehydrogenase (NAD+)